MKKITVLLLLLILVSSCVSFSGPAKVDELPNPEKAYLYGNFEIIRAFGMLSIAIKIENIDNGNAYFLRLYEPEENVYATAVLPGSYAITGIHYGWTTGETAEVKEVKTFNSQLTQTFDIAAGDALYLGDYKGSTDALGGTVFWSINEITDNESSTKTRFMMKYSLFSDLNYRSLFN